jgi:hypothetical protein
MNGAQTMIVEPFGLRGDFTVNGALARVNVRYSDRALRPGTIRMLLVVPEGAKVQLPEPMEYDGMLLVAKLIATDVLVSTALLLVASEAAPEMDIEVYSDVDRAAPREALTWSGSASVTFPVAAPRI